MPAILFTLTSLAALFEWLAVYKGWRKLEYFAKPSVMLFLLGWLLVVGGTGGPLVWFVVGVALSLVGDVLLLLPNENRWFLLGLGAFLLAQIAYILGINSPPPSIDALIFGLAFMVILTVLPLIRRIVAGLEQNGLKTLVQPVRIYAAVTSLMLFSALVTMFRADWQATPAYLVSLGVVLFISSDVLLIWNKYIQPVRNGALWIIVTYYLGQIMLVAGALGQFGTFQ